MEHIRLVDTTRALAAGMVLVSHVAFWTGASRIDFLGGFFARGDAGVAVFFALSAYLLLSPAFSAAVSGTGSTRPLIDYAARRAARILPAYWLALVFVIGAGLLGASDDAPGSWRAAASHVFLTQALTGHHYQAFSQTWSLTTEAVFYLLVPLFGWLLMRSAKRFDPGKWVVRTSWLLLSLAFLGPFFAGTARLLVVNGHFQLGTTLGMSVLGHAGWFAAGALVALVKSASEHGAATPFDHVRNLFSSRTTTLLAALLVFAVATSPLAGPRNLSEPTVFEAVTKEVAYTLFAGLVLISAVLPVRTGSSLGSFLDTPFNRWLGDTSYGVFLWHVLVLQLFFSLTGSTLFNAHFGWTLVFVTVLSLGLASASWFLVEKPVLQVVRSRTRSTRRV